MTGLAENASMLLRYRFALVFGAAWLLFALFCFLATLPGGHPPAGILLWLIAYSHTLSGRLIFEIYGTESVMSSGLAGLVLGVIEFSLIGGAIGLILERTLARITSGASLLVAYVAAHMLVAPLTESRPVLVLRLQSSDPGAFRTVLERIRRGTVEVDLLVEELPRIADRSDPRDTLALDTLTELKGVEFWKNYLRSEQGQARSARFCENVLASAERTAPPQCGGLSIDAWLKQLDELTAEVARCYVRELRAGQPPRTSSKALNLQGLHAKAAKPAASAPPRAATEATYQLILLARHFPWLLDEYRDLLLEELASGNLYYGFGIPSDPTDPCYVQGGKKQLLMSGGAKYLKGKSREEVASVLDYWHACPYMRWGRGPGRPSGCR